MPVNIDRRKLQSLGRLELLAKQAVEGFITGLHKSPFHGFSVEFAEHRQYNTGESTRHLDPNREVFCEAIRGGNQPAMPYRD